MGSPQRILVVAGARALSRTVAARLWSLREILAHLNGVTCVAHGDCREGPDLWAWTLARCASINTVAWTAFAEPHVVDGDGMARALRHAERYAYRTPLERNGAMARWAGDMAVAGADVTALTLRCDWPWTDDRRATQGTAHARDRLREALGADRVMDLVCPPQFGPGDAA